MSLFSLLWVLCVCLFYLDNTIALSREKENSPVVRGRCHWSCNNQKVIEY